MSMNKADHLYDHILDGLYRSDVTKEDIIESVMELYRLAEPNAETLRQIEKYKSEAGEENIKC